MRVRFSLPRRRRDDQGAVAAVFAISLVVLFGMSAVAVDVGDIYSTRRNLITGADAAALAAAQEYAFGGNGCAGTDDVYLAKNIADASVASCAVVFNSASSGYVTVAGETTVEHYFAPLVGIPDTDVHATSAAYFGPPSSYFGLRPLGLCAESDGYQAWLASGKSTTQVFRIAYTKEQPTNCGDTVPGNWGVIDFDAGSNSQNDTRSWIRYGYPGEVYLPGWYEGDPGAFSQGMDPASIIGQTIQVPVFDSWNGLPGSNAEFYLVGAVSVEVVGLKANGSEQSRYLDLRFKSGVIVQGSCCGSGGTTGDAVIKLCRFESYESDCTP
jgi:Flp pilus assembly protein TadG